LLGDVLLPPAELVATATSILIAAGTDPGRAAIVARSLVEANLAGHDSHGVLRLPEYVAFVDRGDVLPGAEPVVAYERGAFARVDGRRGWGQLAARLAAETAIRLARSHGVGAVTVDRCTHVGRLGEYVEEIAAAGLVGHALGNADPAVAPPGTAVRAMGTNPVAWAIPRADGDPVLVDFATAEMAEGKLRVAVAREELLPLAAIVDVNGRPSQTPSDFYEGGALVPFGGHKGYGLSVAAELIARGLSAGGPEDGRATRFGLLILALDPAAGAPLETFLSTVGTWCDDVRVRAAAAGATVTLPGDPEASARAGRRRDGIPLPRPTWDALVALRDRLLLAPPAAVEAS
jgi:LDH2 family malate/lactate/ureidoglycolate dehydrogenase